MKFVPHSQADITKVLEGKQGVVTPRVSFGWACLGIPQTEFKDRKGQIKPLQGPTKSCVLIFDPDNTQHQEFMDFCREVYDAGVELMVAEEGLDLEENPAKPFFIKKEKDAENIPTGLCRMSVKKQVGGVRKKDRGPGKEAGTVWTVRLPVLDGHGQAIPENVADTISRGSEGRVAITFRPYVFGNQPGVTTDLHSVQIGKLVERDGAASAFDAWEGDDVFTVEASESKDFAEAVSDSQDSDY